MDEIAFVRHLPAIVLRTERLGGLVGTMPVAVIASSSPIVEITLAPSDAKVLHPGQKGSVATDSGIQMPAQVVGQIRSEEGPNGERAFRATLKLSSKPSVRLSGGSATVTMDVRLSRGKVLAVPLTAIWTGSDGSSRVTVISQAGTTRDVVVISGVSGGGYVEVNPAHEGDLNVRDRVIVG